MIIPETKKDIVAETRKKITEVEVQFSKGIITEGERKNKVIDLWTAATTASRRRSSPSSTRMRARPRFNPVYIMMDSGARGNRAAVRQLCGTRGLMAKPSGEIIERPDSFLVPRGTHGAPSTSSRRTAPARDSPTPRSRRPTPAI